MKVFHSKYSRSAVAWIVASVAWLLLFLFYWLGLPYHFYYREQTSLFLWSWIDWQPWLSTPGALAEWLGRFLTQFFYYEAVGPLILSLMLVILGAGLYRLITCKFRPLTWSVTVIVVAWEAGRASLIAYPLASTITLTAWVWTLYGVRKLWNRHRYHTLPLQLLLLGVAVYAWGVNCWSIRWGRPDFSLEYSLALDCEYYFGRQERLNQLLEKGQTGAYPLVKDYYTHLLHATEGRLPEQLMAAYRSGEKGLFLPVDPSGNYFSIYAANEVWFTLGDYTMAEHAAILGMIFSPKHRGGRALKRMAEINLIQGDEAAAMKYLRILDKTLCYRQWARQRMPLSRTMAVEYWLEQKRSTLPKSDTLRLNGDVVTSLRHLLKRPSPYRSMQIDYLLCYHLMQKDIRSFADDYLRYVATDSHTCSLAGVYAEAMMIYLASTPQAQSDSIIWHFPEPTMQAFRDYTRSYESSHGSAKALYDAYGTTYWFYYHFAQRKGEKKDE